MKEASILSLKDRTIQVQNKIKAAAERSHRSADDITLVAVTKTISPAVIKEALALGLKNFGENKVQEAIAKRAEWPSDQATLHFIGHLQTNKARKAVELFDMIQSVDRPALADTLDRIQGEQGGRLDCLIEVKVSSEETKSGMPLKEASSFIESFERYKNLNLRGLMAIGPLEGPARPSFQAMNQLFQKHRRLFGPSPVLSMGMSDDFEEAIEEGATLVRIGRALFGERTYT